jgi:superkiller protein 8
LSGAHKLGCHHIATSRNGLVAASVGFGGEVKVWRIEADSGEWSEAGQVVDGNKAGEAWAIALSEDGQFLASTTYDGRINVWDLSIVAEKGQIGKKIREYETKGSFGMCIDMSRDGKFTATGHENGAVYVFNNDTGRMLYSLPGNSSPLRPLKCILLTKYRFSKTGPHSFLLASRHTSCSCWRCTDYCSVRCQKWGAGC